MIRSVGALVKLGLSHPKSTSLAVVSVLAPLLLVRDVLLLAPRWDRNLIEVGVISAISVLVTAVLFLMVAPQLASQRGVPERSPVRVACVYLATGLVNLALIVVIATALSVNVAAPLWQAAIQLPLFCALILCFRATLYAAYLRHTSRMIELADQRMTLRELQESQTRTLAAVKRRLADSISVSTLPHLTRALEWIDETEQRHPITEDDLASLEGRLRMIAREHLKPAGRSLRSSDLINDGTTNPNPQHAHAEPPGLGSRAREVFVLAISDRPIHPIAASITASLIVLLTALNPASILLDTSIGCVIAIVVSWVFKLLLRPRLLGWLPTPLRALIVLAAFAAAGALSWLALDLLLQSPYTMVVRNQGVLLALVSILAGMVWTAGPTLVRLFERETTELEAAIATTRWQIDQLELSVQRIQNQLAHLVHTDTQGLVVGCALRLKDVASSATTLDPVDFDVKARDALAGIRLRIADSQQRVNEATLTQEDDMSDVSEGLSRLVAAWNGVVAVTADVDADAAEIANRVSARVQAIIEIAGEAVSNATIHGAARNVELTLRRDGAELVLEATDDGTASDDESTVPGMGSDTLSALTSHWELMRRPFGGCTLTAFIPVDLPTRAATALPQ